MGNSVSDLFYPDNPNRRARAEELRNAINSLGAEFAQQKQLREDIIKRIRPKLDNLLRERGFHTPDQLEQHVNSILSGDELKKYDDLKKRIDRTDAAGAAIFDIVGIVVVASGVVLAVGAIGGIITGAAALAAVGVVAGIAAVLSAVLVLFAIVDGAIERNNLKQAIRDLWPKRAEMKKCLEQMRAIAKWAKSIETWLNNPSNSDPAMLEILLAGTLDDDYRQWTDQKVDLALLKSDNNNRSWTNEDPSRVTVSAMVMAASDPDLGADIAPPAAEGPPPTAEMAAATPAKASPLPDATIKLIPNEGHGKPQLMDLTYEAFEGANECKAKDSVGCDWNIIGKPLDPSKIDLSDVLFDLQNTITGVWIQNCQVIVVSTSTR